MEPDIAKLLEGRVRQRVDRPSQGIPKVSMGAGPPNLEDGLTQALVNMLSQITDQAGCRPSDAIGLVRGVLDQIAAEIGC